MKMAMISLYLPSASKIGERERFEALGLRRAQEFSWARVTEQYEALYRELGAPSKIAAAPALDTL